MAVYYGQRQYPKQIYPRVGPLMTEELVSTMLALQKDIDVQVTKMPFHSDILEKLHTNQSSSTQSAQTDSAGEPSVTFNLNQPAKFSLYGSQS